MLRAGTVGAGIQQPAISDAATAERTRPILPPVYRGKTSGEFVRVSEAHSFSQEDATQAKPVSRPANEARKPQQRTAIIALAQQQLALLPKDDERRRLLELGILRGDVSLLHGLLTQFNK